LKTKDMLQVKAWLFKVARNLFIDWTRKSKSEQRMVERIQIEYQPTSSIGNPEQQLEQKTRQEELEEIMTMLPERMRTILYLREILDFSYKELAKAMNLSESQVKVTLYRAREKFRHYQRLKRGNVSSEKR
jgi:RNA polymerase sigma factor (sigma-70 family)